MAFEIDNSITFATIPMTSFAYVRPLLTGQQKQNLNARFRFQPRIPRAMARSLDASATPWQRWTECRTGRALTFGDTWLAGAQPARPAQMFEPLRNSSNRWIALVDLHRRPLGFSESSAGTGPNANGRTPAPAWQLPCDAHIGRIHSDSNST